LNETPEWVRETASRVTFTEQTKLRIVRTAFYFGELFYRQFPSLKWEVAKIGVYRENPILVGFHGRVELCPLSLVEVQAWRAVRGQSNSTALLGLFNIWSTKVL
jgi:CO dehydrogenase/acetyl-CoA synthase epsilon subunit